MKQGKYLSVAGILCLALFILQGCYTQLAVSQRVYVGEQPYLYSQEENDSQAETSSDSIYEDEALYDTVIWAMDAYDPWYCYDQGWYLNSHFSWGDPYWYPWRYAHYRPYWSRYWYPGWYGFDPFWYDPYYSYGYYPGYYSGYWGGYRTSYRYVDPLPKKKRDWDRRGGDLTDKTISRPSNSTGNQEFTPVGAPGPMVAAEAGTQKEKTRSVKRRATELDIRRAGNRTHKQITKVSKAGKRKYHRFRASKSSKGYSQSKSVKSGGKGTRSVSKGVTSRSSHGSASGSSSRGRSSSSSGGSKSSRSGGKSGGKSRR